MLLPLQCSVLLILSKKPNLSNHSIREWTWHALRVLLLGKNCFKAPKFLWANAFTIEIFIFANFARKLAVADFFYFCCIH